MNIEVQNLPVEDVSCSNCQACCCSLEVLLISDTGIPEQHIYVDEQGNESMVRLADGRCSALNRNTLMCTIYDNRPWVCREFEMGSYECINERAGPAK